MTTEVYENLLVDESTNEEFVRKALSALEADFRSTALVALSDWANLELVAAQIFPAVASLQRPSWGTWNGLLTALKNARRSVLRTATTEVREKIEQAKLLRIVLDLLNEPMGTAVLTHSDR